MKMVRIVIVFTIICMVGCQRGNLQITNQATGMKIIVDAPIGKLKEMYNAGILATGPNAEVDPGQIIIGTNGQMNREAMQFGLAKVKEAGRPIHPITTINQADNIGDKSGDKIKSRVTTTVASSPKTNTQMVIENDEKVNVAWAKYSYGGYGSGGYSGGRRLYGSTTANSGFYRGIISNGSIDKDFILLVNGKNYGLIGRWRRNYPQDRAPYIFLDLPEGEYELKALSPDGHGEVMAISHQSTDVYKDYEFRFPNGNKETVCWHFRLNP